LVGSGCVAARCSLGPAQKIALLILLGLALCATAVHPSASRRFAPLDLSAEKDGLNVKIGKKSDRDL